MITAVIFINLLTQFKIIINNTNQIIVIPRSTHNRQAPYCAILTMEHENCHKYF